MSMRRNYGIFLVFIILVLCPGLSFAVDDFAEWEGVKFYLKGDYQYYIKGFMDRDINGYNGEATGTGPLDETIPLQTMQTERWFQHELDLYPQLVFVEGDEETGNMPYLTFNMRLGVGPYIFSSDIHDRMYTETVDTMTTADTTVVREDREKLQVKECYVQFINTNIGAFLLGKFQTYNQGLVWALSVPPLPNWTFALAWNKANERKLSYFGSDTDYRDKDDTNESMVLAAYQNEEKGILLTLDDQFGWAGSQAFDNLNTFTRFNNAILKVDKEMGLKLDVRAGIVGGTVAELDKMPLANDLNTLNSAGPLLAGLAPLLGLSNGWTVAHPGVTLSYPQTQITDIKMIRDKKQNFYASIVASYNLGIIEPELGYGRCGGPNEWNEIPPYWGYDFEPKEYEEPRVLKTLLLREIEDRYWPLIQTLSTSLYHNQEAYYFERLSLTNLTFAKAGLTLHPTEKFEVFGQACKLWRTNTKYYEKGYWDFFPVQYAFNHMYYSDDGHLHAPLVFKRSDVQYYQKISDDMGTEFTGRVTYKLFNGCEASLLGAYFKVGDFYKDVLTPKPYVVCYVDADDATFGLSNPEAAPHDIKGPYGDADQFVPEDAWTVQFKLDFKFGFGTTEHPFSF